MAQSVYFSGWGAVFFATVFAAAALTWRQCTKSNDLAPGQAGANSDFKAFQRAYLIVYYLAMLADWLQGPYVYALYESYGFSSHDIAVLFVGGFGSSMLFGTFAGAAADRVGRKACGMLYVVLYVASCMTKHFKDYSWLMLGRVLGGIATSLLFSTFESWLVCEHNARGYDASWISRTFSLAYFGNSVAAIVAGIMAEAAAELKPLTPLAPSAGPPSLLHYGGFTAPFDLSMGVLLVLGVALGCLWNENYGSTSSSAASASDELWKALRALSRDKAILLLGTAISLFEGSMYVFVFKWTPTLTPGSDKPPYGLIFSTFMVCAMCGSSLFGILASSSVRPEKILQVVFVAAAVALALPAVSSSVGLNLCCFLVFEACVGEARARERASEREREARARAASAHARLPSLRRARPRAALPPPASRPSPAGIYFPAMGMLKSQLVPEEVRATVYNIFRVPLNLIVLGVLLNSLSQFQAFAACGTMLALAAVCLLQLSKMHTHGYTVRSGERVLLASAEDKAETCQL